MTQFLFSTRARAAATCGVVLALGALSAGPAMANKKPTPGSIDTTKCAKPDFTQPFLSIGDDHWYTLAPGQSAGSFDGAGWELTGGAQVEAAPVADSDSGSVLDLPSGSRAVSPAICVDTGFKAARTMVRSVSGKGGVRVTVSYLGTRSEERPKSTGRIHGQKTNWTTSRRFNVKPSNQPGWQLVRFGFAPQGKSSEFQIYDFYVDPRMK